MTTEHEPGDIDKLPADIANMIDDVSQMRKLEAAYARCSDNAKQSIRKILETRYPRFESAAYAPFDILSRTAGTHRDAMLEASAYISQRSEMRRSLHYWLINSLMDTKKYGSAMRGLPRTDPTLQKLVMSIVKAVELLDEEDSETDGRFDVFWRNQAGVYGIRDDRVVDALFQYPEKAPDIAQLYIERGNVDAVEAFVAAPRALGEGAL